jgi:phosphatidylglycerophosphatase A
MSTPEGAPARGREFAALSVATAGGIGLLRPAPGTWATFATGLAILPLIRCCPGPSLTILLLALAALATVGGLLCAPAAIRRWRRLDPGQVVVDEVAGTLLGLACIPPAVLGAQPLLGVGLVMALFRVFDIAKPYPVGRLEALPGAFGIMADDLAAGLLAGLLAAAWLA